MGGNVLSVFVKCNGDDFLSFLIMCKNNSKIDFMIVFVCPCAIHSLNLSSCEHHNNLYWQCKFFFCGARKKKVCTMLLNKMAPNFKFHKLCWVKDKGTLGPHETKNWGGYNFYGIRCWTQVRQKKLYQNSNPKKKKKLQQQFKQKKLFEL